MATKSKILVIGGTGYIGNYVVEASARAGHPTFALVRDSTISTPSKSKILDHFKNLGVNLVLGDLYSHESLRFFPSEFGNDVDRVHAVEPARTAFATKAKICQAVEAEGIPYTHVVSNFFAGLYLSTFSQPGATAPPRDKVVILGDGNAKAIFNEEADVGTFTIKVVDDPRTLNKILDIRPRGNIYSLNDLVSLWEQKIGKVLDRVYVTEEQLLKNIQGDQGNFEIEPSVGVEATELYPDVKYTNVDEYLNQFV